MGPWLTTTFPGGHNEVPAPAIYAGNNWLRNFYTSYTLAQRNQPRSITIGCDADGLRGRCTELKSTSSPPAGPPSRSTAVLAFGIAFPAVLVVCAFGLAVFFSLLHKAARLQTSHKTVEYSVEMLPSLP